MFEAEHSLCSKQNIPCVRSRTFLVLQAGHSLCSKQDISCIRSRTFLVFEAWSSVCSKQDIPCDRSRTFLAFEAQTSNGSKIARIAPISTIFGRNRSRRPKLFFPKFSRHRNLRVAENFYDERANAHTNEQTTERPSRTDVLRAIFLEKGLSPTIKQGTATFATGCTVNHESRRRL